MSQPHVLSAWSTACLLLAALPVCAQNVQPQHPASEQEYWAQFERRDWEKAILAAEKLVETARTNSNAAPFDLAEDLSLLGNAHLASRSFLAAESAYSEALQILEPRVAPSSERLLEPLRGLGYTLAGSNKHDLAIPYVERALLISRRTHGLFNINQQGLLRQLAASQSRMGNYPAAEQHVQYLIRVGEHTYGAGDPRMANVHTIVGDFYSQAGLVSVGREAYREALRVVEKKLGKNDLATVEPLRSLADSYKRELFLAMVGMRTSERTLTNDALDPGVKAVNPRYLNNEGERALLRAIKTLDSHPTRSTAQFLDTLLDMGDWYMIKSETEAALPHYKRAYALLDQVEPERMEAERAKMSFPVQVFYAIPMLATRNVSRPDDEIEEKYVRILFTVGADGAVREDRVIEQDASPRQVAETVAAIRGARYRPKFVNGEPVETKDVGLRQIFRQRKEREAPPEQPSKS